MSLPHDTRDRHYSYLVNMMEIKCIMHFFLLWSGFKLRTKCGHVDHRYCSCSRKYNSTYGDFMNMQYTLPRLDL